MEIDIMQICHVSLAPVVGGSRIDFYFPLRLELPLPCNCNKLRNLLTLRRAKERRAFKAFACNVKRIASGYAISSSMRVEL